MVALKRRPPGAFQGFGPVAAKLQLLLDPPVADGLTTGSVSRSPPWPRSWSRPVAVSVTRSLGWPTVGRRPRPTRDRGCAGVGARLVVAGPAVSTPAGRAPGTRRPCYPRALVATGLRALRLPEATLRTYRLSRVHWARALTDAEGEPSTSRERRPASGAPLSKTGAIAPGCSGAPRARRRHHPDRGRLPDYTGTTSTSSSSPCRSLGLRV